MGATIQVIGNKVQYADKSLARAISETRSTTNGDVYVLGNEQNRCGLLTEYDEHNGLPRLVQRSTRAPGF